jgi:hypothetical protein
MKKLFIILALLPTLAFAQHYHHGFQGPHWRYQGNNWNWMIPTIVGGVVVYEATKNSQQQPIIIQQQPVVIQQSIETCGPWTEVQTPDGKIYRERVCQK